MSRLQGAFSGGKAFIPFIVAGIHHWRLQSN